MSRAGAAALAHGQSGGATRGSQREQDFFRRGHGAPNGLLSRRLGGGAQALDLKDRLL
jgi:hypothetical protein